MYELFVIDASGEPYTFKESGDVVGLEEIGQWFGEHLAVEFDNKV
jgi:hypothetical protein